MEKHLNSAPLKRQIQVVFGVSILMLIISSYASYFSNQKLISASKWVNHTNEVLIGAENIISYMKDAETGQRGYLLTRDTSFLEPYSGAYAKALSSFNHVKELTLDNPVQQKNLAVLKIMMDKRFAQLQEVINITGNSAGNVRLDILADNDEMFRGKKIMDDVRQNIDAIKNEEKRLLVIRTSEQEAYIQNTPILIIIAACVSILVSILAYTRIKNDIEQRIAKQRQDEAKYRETAERIAEMEKVTNQIAEGDYAIRSNDNHADDLGKIAIALNNMAISLEKSFNELELRNWVQTGTVNLSNAVRGERFVKNVADKVISSLAQYLDIPLGTLYVADGDMNLKFSGGYAVKNAIPEFHEGEGIIGQAVKDKKLIVVSNLPEDYLQITSSTGHTVPPHVLVLPLLHNNEITGVIELAFLKKPEQVEIDFLQANAETIAIAINGVVNYEKMQNLLEETQSQSEELQSQHNELESLNVELEAQTEKLQASEEELKVQQEELQQANTELEEKARLLEERNFEIVEKNKDVQRKAEQLALSTKYKSEFLANMSHELRTPLNSILLLSRLLTENNEQNLSGDQIEYARVIQSSGNGLLSLIDEILDLSKIEAGKMELEHEDILIDEVIGDMQGLFSAVAKEKGLELKIEKGDHLPAIIQSDKQRLEQVLKNLLSNALKFTSKGYVSLQVYNHKTREGIIGFAVEDTGIGIPEEKQHLIFEAFQQADGSTRRKYGGTGLGLSISRELVKLLGGTLELESQPGKGSRFICYIPASKEYKSDVVENNEAADHVFEEVQQAPVENKKDISLPKYTTRLIPENIPDDRAQMTSKDRSILIIDDDTNFAKFLLEYTRKKGYKGIVAVRGDEGVALAKQYRPAGILLDIELPVKSGWEVMEELKADPYVRHIPVHVMSSHSVKKESLQKGAIDFIDKPFAVDQMQQIFNKLEHVLSRTTNKVLIVEDNPKHAKALAYFLETFNINSEIKNTIPDSIHALNSSIDCVILDMGIPDQKAYDMLEEVKETPGLENLPIIIFTGKSLSLAEEQRIKKYADSIVVKTAHSYQRMLDEVSIFLHLVEEQKPKTTLGDYKKLGLLNDVLNDKTVLIVDDDVRNIFSLTKALENFKMNVVTAIDGKEALNKLKENSKIDIVLLDMMMPEMDGYETATMIRQNKNWKNLPVIAVTAKAMMGDRDKCIKAGASDYVTKPVDIDQLVSLLRVWLYEKV